MERIEPRSAGGFIRARPSKQTSGANGLAAAWSAPGRGMISADVRPDCELHVRFHPACGSDAPPGFADVFWLV